MKILWDGTDSKQRGWKHEPNQLGSQKRHNEDRKINKKRPQAIYQLPPKIVDSGFLRKGDGAREINYLTQLSFLTFLEWWGNI